MEVRSTWLARELPILRAVVSAEEVGADPQTAAREAASQITDAEFMKCLDRLREDGLLDVAVLRSDGGLLDAHVRRALPGALREVGLWPRAATPLEKKKRRRLEFMERLYEVTEGRTLIVVSIDQLATELGWPDTEASAVVEYLNAEGLLEHEMGNQASITHAGVVEVEEALEHPSRPTEHFPAINLVMVQGSVVGSQIQAGTIGSEQQQDVQLLAERQVVSQFLDELRAVLASAAVNDEDRAAANADIASVKAQLASPRPNAAVIREGLRSLRSVAENLVASGAFLGLLELAHRLPI